MSIIRKNITLDEIEFELFKQYSLQLNLSFSEFLRKSAHHMIKEIENQELSSFLEMNAPYLSEIEELQILDYLDEHAKEFGEDEGVELKLEDFL